MAHSVLSLTGALRDTYGRRRLLVANQGGRILSLWPEGQEDSEITIGGYSVYHLAACHADTEHAVYCGLAYTSDGARHVAIGIDKSFQKQWTRDLSSGLHTVPIEMVTSTHLGPKSQVWWLIPGADGSIQFVSADGQWNDQFNYGEQLRGLSARRWGAHRYCWFLRPAG